MTRAVLNLHLPEFETLLKETTVEGVELLDVLSSRPTRVLVWVDGADPKTVASVCGSDSTVSSVRHLESDGSNHLFRVEFGSNSPLSGLHDRLVDLDGFVRRATAGKDGWTIELFLPDQESLATVFSHAREIDSRPVVRSITRETDGRDSYGLTTMQRDTLLTAFEQGYFSIPKDVTLVDLANELGVSDQAASERLRRAIQTLVCETVRDEHESRSR